MASEPRTGSLLRSLAAAKPKGRFLELGTEQESPRLPAGMDAGSMLTTVDTDASVQQVARELLSQDPRLQLVLEDGLEFLRREPARSFDFVFADAIRVGDERAVAPIIEEMKSATSDPISERRCRTLLAGNFALTNITAADVIWHYGGGIPFPRCPDDPAACWAAWWQQNAATFRIRDIKQSRRYTN
jgi:hypothetical protein